jgi:hypothetical protein
MSFDDYLGPEQEFFLFRPDRGPEGLDRGGSRSAGGDRCAAPVPRRRAAPPGRQRRGSGISVAAPADLRPEGAETAVAREPKSLRAQGHSGARLAGNPCPPRSASRPRDPSLRPRALPRQVVLPLTHTSWSADITHRPARYRGRTDANGRALASSPGHSCRASSPSTKAKSEGGFDTRHRPPAPPRRLTGRRRFSDSRRVVNAPDWHSLRTSPRRSRSPQTIGTSRHPRSPKRAPNRPKLAASCRRLVSGTSLICRSYVSNPAALRLAENRGVPGSSPGLAIPRSTCKSAILSAVLSASS